MIISYYGTESRLIAFEKRVALEKSKHSTLSNFDASQKKEVEAFVENMSQGSLFETSKLIILRRVEKNGKFTELLKTLLFYSSTPHTIILDYSSEKKLTAAQEKQMVKLGEFHKFVEKSDKENFLALIKNTLSCSSSDAMKLFLFLPLNYYTVMNSLKKLVTFFHSEPFDFETAKTLLITRETAIFQLIEDFFSSKQPQDLMRYLEKNRAYMLFLALISDDILMCYLLKQIELEEKINLKSVSYANFSARYYSTVSVILYKHAYAYYKKIQLLEHFTVAQLKGILYDIYTAEKNIKTGRQSDEIAIFQLIKKIETTIKE